MTTSPVISVTDELIAELEQIYMAGWQASGEGWNAEYPGDAHEAKPFIEGMRNACCPVAAKLLTERAELKRDADCLRWLMDQGDNTQWQNILRIEVDDYATVRDAINEVMRQEAKP